MNTLMLDKPAYELEAKLEDFLRVDIVRLAKLDIDKRRIAVRPGEKGDVVTMAEIKAPVPRMRGAGALLLIWFRRPVTLPKTRRNGRISAPAWPPPREQVRLRPPTFRPLR